MTDKKLLDVKANLKKKQPAFIRQDAHKRKRLPKVWRSPTGWHNKVGDNKRGYRKHLKGGYQTPKAVRGLNKDGLLPVLVSTLAELSGLDNKTHVVIVSGKLGGKKKVAIINAALAAGFTLQNATKESAAKIEERFKKQSAEKKSREQEREKKHKELEKVAEKKEAEEKEEGAEKPAEEEITEKKVEAKPVEEKPVEKKAPAKKKAAKKKAPAKKKEVDK